MTALCYGRIDNSGFPGIVRGLSVIQFWSPAEPLVLADPKPSLSITDAMKSNIDTISWSRIDRYRSRINVFQSLPVHLIKSVMMCVDLLVDRFFRSNKLVDVNSSKLHGTVSGLVRWLFVLLVGSAGTLNLAQAQCGSAFPARLPLRVLLDGPYDRSTGLMTDSLRSAGSIPLVEPYSSLGYTFRAGGGGEQIGPEVLSVEGADAIVDWIIVEVRDPYDPGRCLASRSALVQRDGDVVDLNGVDDVGLCVDAGSYRIAVRHRNHLGIMTGRPVEFISGQFDSVFAEPLDLSSPQTLVYRENQARKQVGQRLVLWCGDVNFDGVVKYVGPSNDRDPILQDIGGSVPTSVVYDVYASPDVNLDTRVQYVGQGNDRDRILQTVGGGVPTNTREGYIPKDSLTLRPNVHIMDSIALQLDPDRSDIDSNTVMVYAIEGPIPDIDIDHVVVGHDPNGVYLRLVTSAVITNDSLYLTTVQGALADVFSSGCVALSFDLDGLTEVSGNGFVPGGGQSTAARSGSLYYAEQIPIPLNGASSANVRLEDVSIDLTGRPVMNMEFGPSGLKRAEMATRDINASVSYKLRLEGTLGVDSLELPLGKWTKPYVGAIGPVPVELDFEVTFKAKAKIELSGAVNVTTQVGLTASGDYGALYDEDAQGWTDINSFNLGEPSISSELGSLNLSAKASLEFPVELWVKMYKAPAGPYANTGSSYSATLSASASLTQGGVVPLPDHNLSASAKWKSKVGVKAKVLDRFVFDRSITYESAPFAEYKTPFRFDTTAFLGKNQVGELGYPLSDPLRVRVKNRLSYDLSVFGFNPLGSLGSGTYYGDVLWAPVNFTVLSGGGTVYPQRVWTDPDGFADTQWTLGTSTTEPQRVLAYMLNAAGDTIGTPYIFKADTADLHMEKISGDLQIGSTGSALAHPLVVKILDQLDEPMEGIHVHFDVVDGNGSVTDDLVLSNVDGLASTYFTLGSDAAEKHRVKAYVLDAVGDTIQDAPQYFKAYIDPDTMMYAQLSGNNQVGDASTVLPVDLRVQVNAVLGQEPQEDVLVYFQVVSGGGTVSSFGTSTNSDGIASVAWTLGPDLTIRQIVKAWALDVYGDTLRGGPLYFEACTIICPPSVMDIDGNVYPVVKIGCDCWTQQNLRTEHYTNGDAITVYSTSTIYPSDTEDNEPQDNPFWWDAAMIEYLGAMPHDGPTYTYQAAQDSRGVCPVGWHVSDAFDWANMARSIGVPENQIIPGVDITYEPNGVDFSATIKLPSAWPGDSSATNLTGLSVVPGPVIHSPFGVSPDVAFTLYPDGYYSLRFDEGLICCGAPLTSYTGLWGGGPQGMKIQAVPANVGCFCPSSPTTQYIRCVMD